MMAGGPMAVPWTNERTLHLINLYRSMELLWDPTNEEYKDRNKRKAAWDFMGRAMNENTREIERKMRNVLSQFYREYSRRAKRKSGSVDLKESKWFAYPYLLFVKQRNRSESAVETQAMDECDLDEISTKSEVDNEDCEIPTDEDISIRSEGDNEDCEVPTDELHTEETGTPTCDRPSQIWKPPLKIQSLPNEAENPMCDRPSDTLKPPLKIAKLPKNWKVLGKYQICHGPDAQTMAEYNVRSNVTTAAKNVSKEKDEYDIFGEHVAVKLRKLTTTYAKEFVQHKISTLLFEASIGNYDKQESKSEPRNRSPSPSSSTQTSSSAVLSAAPSFPVPAPSSFPLPPRTASPTGIPPVDEQLGSSQVRHEGGYYILWE